MNQLQIFAARALRQLPTSLWWVLTLLVGSVCSITLEKELFPNTPSASVVAQWVFIGCMLVLPTLGIVWVWQVAMHVVQPGWRLLWYIAATGATAVGAGLTILLLVVTLLFAA
ncbi:hypothetical protein MTX78_17920 [Hymenobacter tibetensis]|uniref:Uncharacterized protein n=1 Tax=Hymenobacter tibetensis TaxID=497967 RepID=A0ABY4D200_9BACT|nr:hypothetical protein [Hymenobacter tibetensis]UOG73988.1 hypothetical protein MTX78_17920 [Hymenobacter tibetensis]